MPVGLRSRVPAKITSSTRTPRRLLADCSPSTQELESAILDFPQPLGPTTAAIPSPGNFSSVLSQKDLNPRICSLFSLSNVLLLLEWPIVTRRRQCCVKHLPHISWNRLQLMYRESQQGSSTKPTRCCG